MARWQYQGLAEPVTVPAAGAETITCDKWSPSLVVPTRRRRFGDPGFHVEPLEPSLTTAPPPLSWQGSQPDRISPRTRRPLGTGITVVDPSLYVLPPELSWEGQYPDRINPRPKRPLGVGATVVEPSLFVSPPALSWLGEQPERIAPKVRRPLGVGITVTEPTLLVEPGFPDLSWLGETPDGRLRPLPQRSPGVGTTVVDPSLYVAPPPLSWLPDFPDRISPRPRRSPSEGVGVVQIPAPVLPDLSWSPDYPDRIPPRQRRPLGVGVTVSDPSLYLPPPVLSWLARLPDGRLLARIRRPLGLGVTVGDPTLYVEPGTLTTRIIRVLGQRNTTFTVLGQRGTTISVLGQRGTTVSVEGSLTVAIRTDFDVHRSEDVNIDFDIDESIVGWALRLSLISMSGTELVYKTIGAGITITSGAAGTGRGVFDSADLDRTMNTYRWSLARTDTGYKAVLAYGLVNILPPEALP